ncbi:sporulation membrane protein YtaF [Gracilibacillus sp. S3-1-1]|uniref:Sporulation membrane protein YtaF n=1 Tax=Gracilibacillus pellucidus TaxID=3095368 RepID=A0ACC6M6V0_9BACI|nr:sporulation membrane protein YtaF [Gracilibacillus sp. S3-1-1]MDX8046684.1 sporulation membrane protein YtaF [Gracilibacillus sp. S3-1-1]
MMLTFIIIAISIDSFLVAFTYGLRGINLPIKELAKISVTVGLFFAISMLAGTILTSFISVRATEIVGGLILALVGSFILLSLLHEKKKKTPLLINILKKPASADIDKSGQINGVEPYLIGIALSLDSFGAGIGVYMLGASPVWTPLYVIVMTALFLISGVYAGKYFANIKALKKMSFIPGFMLIIIGIWKIISV